MPEFEYRSPKIPFLRRIMRRVFCAGMLVIAFSGVGICQVPGYGEKPDQWAPYEQGKYFEQLRRLANTYRLPEGKISYLHFELKDGGVGPVEVFRVPMARNEDCHESDCFLFSLVAFDHDETPLVTTCQFKRARLVDLYTPDDLDFFGFEFSCLDTVLQVHVTPTHFMTVPYRP
jgi:hypothetical protein